MGRDSLAPGFRFHPTDEELVSYYLKRKVCSKPLRVDPISVIDIYKSEPWDLPDKSKLKTRDLEWYFFSALDKKYGNGWRTNRATEKGYWKTTGKDRPINHKSRTVGMKKTLVFHIGRAPKGARTNWVMHEYRLEDEELKNAGIQQDAFVLCRIFQKSGTGPKNGEQYGAPFVEEEWDDDEEVMVPGEVLVGDGALDVNELDQNFSIGIPSEMAALASNFHHGQTSNYVEQSGDFAEEDPSEVAPPAPFYHGETSNYNSGDFAEDDPSEVVPPAPFYHGETSNYNSGDFVEDDPSEVAPPAPFYHGETSNYNSGDFAEDDLKPPIIGREISELGDGQTFFELPEQYEMNAQPIKEEYFGQPSNSENPANPADFVYTHVEEFLNDTENPPFKEGLYLETNDLSKPIEADPAGFDMIDEFLNYFDAEEDIAQYLDLDSFQVMGTENNVPEEEPISQNLATGEAEVVPPGTKQSVEALHDNNGASSSNQNEEVKKFESDFKYQFSKQASQMLGSIPAPPAFAAEFPTKDAALRLNSVAQSSSSVHVTAAVIRIRNLTPDGNGMDWSLGKNEHVNFILTDASSASMVPMVGSLSGKAGSVVSKGLFFFMFIWVLIISVSFKIGSHIYTR